MDLLLDTHSFLWYYSGSSELSTNSRSIIAKPENKIFVSLASLWEIAIKNSLGKLDLEAPLDVFFSDISAQGFNLFPITSSHILHSASLPFHHRDPFDRLLIGQSIAENMPIVTKDRFFEAYCISSGLKTIW